MNYFNDIITDEQHFIDLPDCVNDGSSYKETIEKAFNLTKGLLSLDEFNWKLNDGNYELDLVVNGQPHSFSVQ